MPRAASPDQNPPGSNVYRLRIAAKLSQRALAEKCKPALDHTTIQRLEQNRGYTQDTLERVAKALHCTVQDLFLPEELRDWPTLTSAARSRLAESIQDAIVAARYRRG